VHKQTFLAMIGWIGKKAPPVKTCHALPICQCGAADQGHRIRVIDLAMSRVCQALPCMQQLSALDLEDLDVNKMKIM
jgi:hypothetical protein